MEGRHIAQLRDAISGAFTAGELEMLVRISLDETLAEIVKADAALNKVAFDLIAAVERAGEPMVERLLAALVAARPGNASVRDAVMAIRHCTLTQSSRVWKPLVDYPLQPAQCFSGRRQLLHDLSGWATTANTPIRVRALVAVGGTGKTALAAQFLAGLPEENPFGVLVWNFYENPRTEAFLRAACHYFLGEASTQAGGLLNQLQNGLHTSGLPHLFILDGLERVQSTGTLSIPRGALEDPLMRQLLRWLVGRGTKAKALITSRFPIPDLADWINKGFDPHPLEDLEQDSARAVLRQRGVKGSDVDLDGLSSSVHNHALTVDVLGLFIARFGAGNPKAATRFNLKSFGMSQKAEQLSSVLASYAEQLPNDERDVLVRLALIPRGVTVDLLSALKELGGEVAGSLAGYEQHQLVHLLENLRETGLVFLSETPEGRWYSAHPFLRSFFSGLYNAETKGVHDCVQNHLRLSLGDRPDAQVTRANVDFYERLIEETALAGKVRDAWFGGFLGWFGGFNHLGRRLGEYSRGCRVASMIFETRPPGHDGTPELDAAFCGQWGRFALALGDLTTARKAFAYHTEHCSTLAGGKECGNGTEGLFFVELFAGRWSVAERIARDWATVRDDNGIESCPPSGYRGFALFGLGRVHEARNEFATSDRHRRMGWGDLPGTDIWESEFSFRLGEVERVRIRVESLLRSKAVIFEREEEQEDEMAVCNAILGRCCVPDSLEKAIESLHAGRGYANRTGHAEVALRCYLLAAEIARHEGSFAVAKSEALDGIQHADSCGFGRWSLDIRTELANIHLAAGEWSEAIPPAEWVLKRSQEEDCQYAWGIADSLHQLGVAFARLGKTAKARDYLNRAVENRRDLEHPCLCDTEAELNALPNN